MRINRIFKNTSIGVLQNVFNILVSVFVNGYIAAKLGTEAYGQFIFAFAFPQVFSVIADFGLQGYYTKKIANDRENTRRYLGDMVVIRLGFSVLAVLIALIALLLTGHSGEARTAILIGILSVLIAQTFITNAWTVFQAHEEMQFVAGSNILSRVIIAFFSVLVLQFQGQLLAVTVVYGLGYLVQVGYCFRILLRQGWVPRYSLQELQVLSILREAWPFSLFGIFSYLALAIDKTLLSLISGDAALGIYNAAASLTMNSFMISIAVANALFPALVQAFSRGDMKDFSGKMEVILKWMFLLGAPLALIITYYAREIILFIFHSTSYLSAVRVLQLLIWLLPIDLVARILRYALIAVDREHIVTKYYGIGLGINIVSNVLLMPHFSYMGAACSAMITQLFLLIVLAALYYRTLKTAVTLPWVRLLAGNLVLAGTLFFFGDRVHWILGGILGVALFAVMMLGSRVVTRSELDRVLMRRGNP